MRYRAPTASGFSEGPGIGYAIEKIGDPGRGLKDSSYLTTALGGLESLRDVVKRAERADWATKADLQAYVSEFRSAAEQYERLLSGRFTRAAAKEAGEDVIRAYERFWRAIEDY